MNSVYLLENLLQPPVASSGLLYVLSSLLGVWAILGERRKADCVPGHQMRHEPGAFCCAHQRTHCWLSRLTSPRCRMYPGASPQLCILYIFDLITVCTLFTPPFPQVFPDNARKGHSVPRSLAKNVTRLAWRGFFSGVGSPHRLCRELEKLSSVLPRVAFPHLWSPTREMIPYDSWFHQKNAPNE